jgi:predicted regulator of amino acid metabolism with ACT domain
MSNITKEVWKVIESDLAIEKDLARNLINTRALARFIIDKYTLKTKRRFIDADQKIVNLFRDAVIKTHNNMACITAHHKKGDIDQLLDRLSKMKGIRVATGTENTRIITDQHQLREVTRAVPPKLRTEINGDLSELSITIDEKAGRTKGVLARITNEISLANINIEEMMIPHPEFLIYVKQQNILKAYESVLKLRNKE